MKVHISMPSTDFFFFFALCVIHEVVIFITNQIKKKFFLTKYFDMKYKFVMSCKTLYFYAHMSKLF